MTKGLFKSSVLVDNLLVSPPEPLFNKPALSRLGATVLGLVCSGYLLQWHIRHGIIDGRTTLEVPLDEVFHSH